MGGHGALTIAMRDPSRWVSVSAFAPICNPSQCPWGEHAFRSYLGSVAAGADHDASLLLDAKGPFPEYDDILVDQGLKDGFLAEGQLRPEALEAAARRVGQNLTVRRHPDHGHSYYFVASFVGDHVEFHAARLRKKLELTSVAHSLDSPGHPPTPNKFREQP
jgi:S-formylglutathione hydrolase